MGLFQNSKKIKFDGKECLIKLPSLGATFLWEETENKHISEMKTTRDNVLFVYCLFKACNDEFEYTFDEFTKELDRNSEPLEQAYKYMLKKK